MLYFLSDIVYNKRYSVIYSVMYNYNYKNANLLIQQHTNYTFPYIPVPAHIPAHCAAHTHHHVPIQCMPYSVCHTTTRIAVHVI